MSLPEATVGRRPQAVAAALAAVCALLLFNLTWLLASERVADYDEARHVVSSVEMLRSGQWVITTWLGQPDLWNLKPPLAVWLQAASMQIFGVSIGAARLPSVLAALLAALSTGLIARRIGDARTAVLAVLLAFTSWHFITRHGMRSADPDAIFLACIAGAFAATARGDARGLVLAWALIGLGFMAKSFHALVYGAVIGLHALIGQWRGERRWPEVWLAPLALLPVVLPWMAWRYQADGLQFLGSMFGVDVVDRMNRPAEPPNEPAWFYLWRVISPFGVAWLAVAWLAWQHPRMAWLRSPLARLLLLWIALPLLVYSLSSTRFRWYIYPLMPALAIVIALVIRQAGAAATPVRRRIAWGLLGVAIAWNQGSLMWQVWSQQYDATQQALRGLAAPAGQSARRVYITGARETWEQDHHAVAALRGGLALREGGAAAFRADPQPACLLEWPRAGVSCKA